MTRPTLGCKRFCFFSSPQNVGAAAKVLRRTGDGGSPQLAHRETLSRSEKLHHSDPKSVVVGGLLLLYTMQYAVRFVNTFYGALLQSGRCPHLPLVVMGRVAAEPSCSTRQYLRNWELRNQGLTWRTEHKRGGADPQTPDHSLSFRRSGDGGYDLNPSTSSENVLVGSDTLLLIDYIVRDD